MAWTQSVTTQHTVTCSLSLLQEREGKNTQKRQCKGIPSLPLKDTDTQPAPMQWLPSPKYPLLRFCHWICYLYNPLVSLGVSCLCLLQAPCQPPAYLLWVAGCETEKALSLSKHWLGINQTIKTVWITYPKHNAIGADTRKIYSFPVKPST